MEVLLIVSLIVAVIGLIGINQFYKKMGIPFLSIMIAVILIDLIAAGISFAVASGWIKTSSSDIMVQLVFGIAQLFVVVAIWNITYKLFVRVWSGGAFFLSLLFQIAFGAASRSELMELITTGNIKGFLLSLKNLILNPNIYGIVCAVAIAGYLLIQILLAWKISRCFYLGDRKDDSNVQNLVLHIVMFLFMMVLPPVGMFLLGVLPVKYHKIENI